MEEPMRRRSRELRELLVRVLAGLGLVLALGVMGAVLVATAVTGDERGDSSVALPPSGGFGEGAATGGADAMDQGSRDPSYSGVLLGGVLLTGGIAVLGWGALRPKAEPTHVRRLQPVSD
jgi:hypothetical protein